MGLFGKKKTADADKVETGAEITKVITEGLSIKVLGSGCAKCLALEEVTKEALRDLNLNVPVGHVTDFVEIAGYGVMTTPALVINEKVASSGRVLKKNEVKELIQKAQA